MTIPTTRSVRAVLRPAHPAEVAHGGAFASWVRPHLEGVMARLARRVTGVRVDAHELGIDVHDAVGLRGDIASVVVEHTAGRLALRVDPTLRSLVEVSWAGASDDGLGTLVYAAAELVAGTGVSVVGEATTWEGLEAWCGPSQVWSFVVRVGDTAGRAEVWVPFRTAARLAMPSAKPESARLGARFVAVVGRASLPMESLRALAVGDAIVPDDLTARWQAGRIAGEVMLTSRRGALRVEMDGVDARVLVGYRERPRTVEPEVPMTEHAALPLEHLPVELTIEVARVELRLDELAKLAEGSVLPLALPGDGRVTLSSLGETVAEGELVHLEGQLAVRILRLARR